MSIITLTTDWQKKDHYIGLVKGKIISKNAGIQIIDINHQVGLHDIAEAAFIVSNCYYVYPEGTVHIIYVNSSVSARRPLLLIEHNNHYFLCADNGLPGLLFPGQPVKVFAIEPNIDKDPYVHVATGLHKGKKPAQMGTETTGFKKQIPFLPAIDDDEINSRVIYIDSYSNIITNVNKTIFEQVGKGREFKILLQSNHYSVQKISADYLETPPGDLLALFNNAGLLEIAISYGAAAELLNIEKGSNIRIKFIDKRKDTLTLTGN